jgi:hypothetical protein
MNRVEHSHRIPRISAGKRNEKVEQRRWGNEHIQGVSKRALPI